MEVQKAQAEAESQRNRRVKGDLAQADPEVFEAQAKVEADAVELADEEEAVDARIEKKDLVEDGQVRRPRALKPAQVNGQAHHG